VLVTRNARAFVFGAVLIVLASGCGGGKATPTIVPVEGVVRIDGQPLQKVRVRFLPEGEYGPDFTASGVTDEVGHFTLTCKSQPGACTGENQVLILETPPPALPRDAQGHPHAEAYYEKLGGRPVPPEYANVVSSPLKMTVTADQKMYTIDLVRPPSAQ
jgi:hypothetical protein